jgi:hypothetical protein
VRFFLYLGYLLYNWHPRKFDETATLLKLDWTTKGNIGMIFDINENMNQQQTYKIRREYVKRADEVVGRTIAEISA